MKEDSEWIHEILDGDIEPGDASRRRGEADLAVLEGYRRALAHLEETRDVAPEGFVHSVMASLPDRPAALWQHRLAAFWPARGRWALPALAGALTTLLVVVLGFHGARLVRGPAEEDVQVTFEVHVPQAQRVEVVGSFTGWKPGKIVLKGPDRSGHWMTTVKLPKGRHEYLYLVDGRNWLTDPDADAYRPDGFGQENAVLEI